MGSKTVPSDDRYGRPLSVHLVLVWNDFTSTGVLRKVQETVTTWTSLGVHVRASLVSRDPRAHDWAKSLGETSHPWCADAWTYRSPLTLNATMRACLRHGVPDEVDVIYSRFDLFLPSLAVRTRSTPLVLEVNSNLHQELARVRSASAIYRRATFGLTKSVAAGITFVSNELCASRDFADYRGARTVIANGIDLASVAPAARPEAVLGRPRAAFIGSPNQPWHGVDKIVWLARQRPSWTFDIIGEEAPSTSVPDNVTFHGVLRRDAYTSLLQAADVAFGTLALHRKGMHEASPLKVREYLALGVPTIIGYQDTDIDADTAWLLSLPNQESNVKDNVERIDRFVAEWRGRRVPRDELAMIDIRTKEERRLAFFREVVARRGTERS